MNFRTMNLKQVIMIVLENVNKVFYTDEIETHALENINLTIKAGEFASIMGPSGCGKSTMLNIMGLLDTPTSGSVIIDGDTDRLNVGQGYGSYAQLEIRFYFSKFPFDTFFECVR